MTTNESLRIKTKRPSGRPAYSAKFLEKGGIFNENKNLQYP